MYDTYLLSVDLFCYTVLVSNFWKNVGMIVTCNKIGFTCNEFYVKCKKKKKKKKCTEKGDGVDERERQLSFGIRINRLKTN